MLHALVTQLQSLEQTLQAALTPTNGAAAAPPRLPPAERHRRWALEQDLLTDRAFREGYEVLQPSRWMHRFWPSLLQLNTALQRVETNSFTQLGGGEEAYSHHARAFYQRLADYRAFTNDLTRQAEHLARGRFEPDTPCQPTKRRRPRRSKAKANPTPVAPVSTPEAEAAALHEPTLAEHRAQPATETP
jgi:hypothetical protein